MKNKKWFLRIIVLLVIAALVTGGIIIDKKRTEQAELAEQQKAEERALGKSYYKQNEAFLLYAKAKYYPPRHEVDKPYYGMYFSLALYKKTTGKVLTYAEIYDYLSREYEEDGEIRIYTNGRHPEIAEYIEWYQQNKEECMDYIMEMVRIESEYRKSYGIDNPREYRRNTAVLDELIKKEADPDYVMDEQIMWEGLSFGPLAESEP